MPCEGTSFALVELAGHDPSGNPEAVSPARVLLERFKLTVGTGVAGTVGVSNAKCGGREDERCADHCGTTGTELLQGFSTFHLSFRVPSRRALQGYMKHLRRGPIEESDRGESAETSTSRAPTAPAVGPHTEMADDRASPCARGCFGSAGPRRQGTARGLPCPIRASHCGHPPTTLPGLPARSTLMLDGRLVRPRRPRPRRRSPDGCRLHD